MTAVSWMVGPRWGQGQQYTCRPGFMLVVCGAAVISNCCSNSSADAASHWPPIYPPYKTAEPTGKPPSAPLLLQIGPALQEIASLKRLRDTLQKQVAQLQQQLSASEREQQSAAAAAAAERARAGRLLSKTQQQLAATLQRLQHMADREQQQQEAMQQVSSYCASMYYCCFFKKSM